jgi:hypothetical protein
VGESKVVEDNLDSVHSMAALCKDDGTRRAVRHQRLRRALKPIDPKVLEDLLGTDMNQPP